MKGSDNFEKWERKEISAVKIMKILQISKSSFYRYANERKKLKNEKS